jgi:hypothetical protein
MRRNAFASCRWVNVFVAVSEVPNTGSTVTVAAPDCTATVVVTSRTRSFTTNPSSVAVTRAPTGTVLPTSTPRASNSFTCTDV